MTASATATFNSANNLAFSERARCRSSEAVTAARFQNDSAVPAQKRAL
jgi:hypothetical protein